MKVNSSEVDTFLPEKRLYLSVGDPATHDAINVMAFYERLDNGRVKSGITIDHIKPIPVNSVGMLAQMLCTARLWVQKAK